MPEEKDISRELRSFGPRIIDVLDSIDFWDIEGEYDPLEIDTAIKSQPEYKRYVAESKEKNSRVWDLVKGLFIGGAIVAGVSRIQRDYKPQIARQVAKEEVKYKGVIPAKPTAKDYMNQYIKERGGEFITGMSRTDQKRLTNFLWQNSNKHERPLAKNILKTEPQLAYLVDNREYRLRMIKRTEINRATMYGSHEHARDIGFKTKTWYTAGDRRVRPSHRALSGVTVLMTEDFPGGISMPGQEVNCRCGLTYAF